jgi:hypothetical protein
MNMEEIESIGYKLTDFIYQNEYEIELFFLNLNKSIIKILYNQLTILQKYYKNDNLTIIEKKKEIRKTRDLINQKINKIKHWRFLNNAAKYV